ncbi:MAG: glycosyltransferase family 39 protein [Candidatus Erginobacter occultus]|nr:glycosyltransferase family 39 protein [Candidatus Erginobacter occultus]
MPFLQSQSEKHVRPGRELSSRSRNYEARKTRAEDLFRFWQGIIFWAVLLFGSFFVFYVLHFRGLVEEEAMEIAARGRAIALGQPGSDLFIRPVYLKSGQAIGSYSAELLSPLYPRVQAFFFKIGGIDDSSAVMAGSLFFLAAALLTYGLARRLVSKQAALLVFFFTFTNPILFRSAINGLPTAFLTFLIVLIFYCRETLPRRVSAGCGGLILGVAFLADYSFLFFLPPFLIYLILSVRDRKERWAGSGIFLAGFLLALAPWLIGEIAGGRGSLGRYLEYHWKSSTALLPGRTADGLFGMPLAAFSLPLSLVVGKVHQGVSLLYREALTISGNFIGLFFWGSVFSLPAAGLRGRRLPVLLLLGAAGIWLALFRPRPEILVTLLPLVILFGTEHFLTLKQRFGPRGKIASRGVVAGFILVNCLPLFFGRVPPDPLKADTINSFSYLRTLIREEESILTDIPAWVHWYGNRTAIRIPLTPEMAREIIRGHRGGIFLLLSPRAVDRGDIDPTGEWRRIYNSRVWSEPQPFDQVMLLPGRLVFMGNRSVLLNRISSRW